jgi:pumilio family protein 6
MRLSVIWPRIQTVRLKTPNFSAFFLSFFFPRRADPQSQGHKAQRALHHQRRASKPHSSILSRAKVLWASARQKNVSAAERKEHICALMDVIRGNVKDVVFKHDASRIVQTVVKYGGQKDRDEIAVELKGHYKELAQNKYSKVHLTHFFFPWGGRADAFCFRSSW